MFVEIYQILHQIGLPKALPAVLGICHTPWAASRALGGYPLDFAGWGAYVGRMSNPIHILRALKPEEAPHLTGVKDKTGLVTLPVALPYTPVEKQVIGQIFSSELKKGNQGRTFPILPSHFVDVAQKRGEHTFGYVLSALHCR